MTPGWELSEETEEREKIGKKQCKFNAKGGSSNDNEVERRESVIESENFLFSEVLYN